MVISRKTNAILFILSAVVTTVGAVNYIVTVGRAQHRFEPDQLTAAIGDTIIFEFYPTNHSVVRGSWGSPCVPYEKVEPQVVGFFSGFRPVRTIESNPPRFSVLVNDTNPIFFYCSAPDSCNVWGMAGVVNPRTDTPIAGYQSEAKRPGVFVLQPGEDWPSEAENTATPFAPSSVPTGSHGLPTQTTAPTPVPASSTTSTLSSGGVAGVTLGIVFAIALICGLFYFLGRRRQAHPLRSQSIIYEKQPPGGFIPPISPPPHVVSPLYGGSFGYVYTPDPRAFSPGVLADDQAPRRSQQGLAVEMGGAVKDSRENSYAGPASPKAPQSDTGERWSGRN